MHHSFLERLDEAIVDLGVHLLIIDGLVVLNALRFLAHLVKGLHVGGILSGLERVFVVSVALIGLLRLFVLRFLELLDDGL